MSERRASDRGRLWVQEEEGEDSRCRKRVEGGLASADTVPQYESNIDRRTLKDQAGKGSVPLCGTAVEQQ